MITVKGSKTQNAADPSSKDRFNLESFEARSNMPYYVGLFVSTVVVYLRSVLGSWAEPHRPDHHGRSGHPADQQYDASAADDAAQAAPSPNAQSLQNQPTDFDNSSAWDGQALSTLPALGLSQFGGDSIPLPDLFEQGSGHIVRNGPVNFAALATNDNRRSGGDLSSIPSDAGATIHTFPGHVTPVQDGGGQGSSGGGNARKNRAPRNEASVDLGNQIGATALVIALTDLLKNTVDPDGNPLYITDFQSSSGILTAADGGVKFQPTQTGEVTFTYTITDGELTVNQQATLLVMPNTIAGGDSNDTLAGSGFADDITGGAGNDSIDGGGGNDMINGGSGDDTIFAGDGNDTVHAGFGNDTVYGGLGNDRLFGEDGNDRLFGEQGNDTLDGGAGNDLLSGGQGTDSVLGGAGDDSIIGDTDAANDTYDGGAGTDTLDYSRASTGMNVNLASGTATGVEIGTDTISGFEVVLTGNGADQITAGSLAIVVNAGAGNDQVTGSVVNDKLFGGSGDDHMAGGEGNDFLIGGLGADTLDCGGGDDTVVGDVDARDDTIIGGLGFDTLDYSGSSAAIFANLVTGIVSGTEIGTDMISGFEFAAFGSADDYILAGNDAVTLAGGGGNDVFEFTINTQSLPSSGNIMQHITDYMVGDCLKTSKYDVFQDDLGAGSDRFVDAFGQALDNSQLSIQVRHEMVGSIQQTFVDCDTDGDSTYDLTVFLDGEHVLHIVQHL
jgi:Ca2+-binding RTX toxin-like protein